MTMKEEELIERLMRENEDFSKTKQAHSQLVKQLEELEKKPFLTPQDEMEIKIIKKKKLALKDQMEKILIKYRP
jgi:uncharacterized protein YdcH (DUF465 family)